MDPEDLKKFYSEAHWREYSRGFAKGQAEALLMILKHLGLAMTTDQQDRIRTCTDLATVERWLDRAFSVTSADELLA